MTALLTAGVFLGVGLIIISLDSHRVRDGLSGALVASVAAALISWRWAKRQS